MHKRVILTMGVLVLVILAATLWTTNTSQAISSELVNLPAPNQAETNLLANGDMDQLPFYFRPTNHFVAGMWYEWWVSPNLPEFIDGRSHQQCYPKPPAGKSCYDEKNKSQGYIRWGAPYTAGIYQPVSVTPCQYYEFTVYNRNDESNYHAKVGIDPTGWQLPIKNERLPNNCPPTGSSICPDPSLDSLADIPSTMIWSPESSHTAQTWAPLSVVAEAVSTTISVWTYAAPEGTSPSQSTYWDEASLVQVAPPNGLLASSGALPPADGSITSVTSGTFLSMVTIGWQTTKPALSQVLYHYAGPVSSTDLTPIVTNTEDYEFRSEISTVFGTSHQVELHNLALGAVYDVALISRHWTGSQCQPSVYLTRIKTSDMLIPIGALPAADGKITNIVSTTVFNASTIEWQTPDPAYAQVLYHYVGDAAGTLLPPIAANTQQYEMKTAISASANTSHKLRLQNLKPLSLYDVALITCQVVNNQCQNSVYTTRLRTTDLIVPAGALPLPDGGIVELSILPFEHSAYVVWQSASPAYAQVLYDYGGPITATIPPSLPNHVYLPSVASARSNNGLTSNYEFKTWPITATTTLHIVPLTNLQADSHYSVVALSSWSEDEQDRYVTSDVTCFYTHKTPTLAASVAPDQLVERLQECLASRPLAVCIDELSR